VAWPSSALSSRPRCAVPLRAPSLNLRAVLLCGLEHADAIAGFEPESSSLPGQIRAAQESSYRFNAHRAALDPQLCTLYLSPAKPNAGEHLSVVCLSCGRHGCPHWTFTRPVFSLPMAAHHPRPERGHSRPVLLVPFGSGGGGLAHAGGWPDSHLFHGAHSLTLGPLLPLSLSLSLSLSLALSGWLSSWMSVGALPRFQIWSRPHASAADVSMDCDCDSSQCLHG
jgi:hypothetical protein